MGERTGDLYLNDSAYFETCPSCLGDQLGGYLVLKKWLGYRQADRRGSQPLTAKERRWLREVVPRIGALLALGPRLDALYQEAAVSAFIAEEPQIQR